MTKKLAFAQTKKTTQEHVIQCYKRYAPWYDKIFGRILQPGRKAIAVEIESIFPENILEIGVGTGLMLPMYPKKIPITGVDISLEMLEKAKEKVNSKRLNQISLLQVSGEELPFEDNSFSCIVLPYTYSVTPNPTQLIKEVRRVCKEGGKIIIVNHFSGEKSMWNIFEKISKPFVRKIGFNSDFSYHQYIESIDWHIERYYSINLFKLSKVVIIRN